MSHIHINVGWLKNIFIAVYKQMYRRNCDEIWLSKKKHQTYILNKTVDDCSMRIHHLILLEKEHSKRDK
jgi:hypothetical protein